MSDHSMIQFQLCSLSITHVCISEVVNPTELDLILRSISINNCQQQVLTLLTWHCVLTITIKTFPFLFPWTMWPCLRSSSKSLTQSLPNSLNASTGPSPSQRAPTALELQLTEKLKAAQRSQDNTEPENCNKDSYDVTILHFSQAKKCQGSSRCPFREASVCALPSNWDMDTGTAGWVRQSCHPPPGYSWSL